MYLKNLKKNRFLFPTSDLLMSVVPDFLNELNLNWRRAILYRTVLSDLSDLRDVYYDVLAFFSPSGIESLFKNFPDFQQKNTELQLMVKQQLKQQMPVLKFR